GQSGTSGSCCSRRNASRGARGSPCHARGAQLCLRRPAGPRTARCTAPLRRECARRHRGSTMQTRSGWFRIGAVVLVLGVGGCGATEGPKSGGSASGPSPGTPDPSAPSRMVQNRFGFSRTETSDGSPLKDPSHPFFQSLGENGRSCSSCHVPESGMSITPEFVRDRFERTDGLDPLFRTVDGSDSPLVDVSTLDARRAAFGLLLDRALIRVGI